MLCIIFVYLEPNLKKLVPRTWLSSIYQFKIILIGITLISLAVLRNNYSWFMYVTPAVFLSSLVDIAVRCGDNYRQPHLIAADNQHQS